MGCYVDGRFLMFEPPSRKATDGQGDAQIRAKLIEKLQLEAKDRGSKSPESGSRRRPRQSHPRPKLCVSQCASDGKYIILE